MKIKVILSALTISLIASCGKGEKGEKGDTIPSSRKDYSDVKIVQFCSKETSVHTDYSEVGFCIQNKLYANYRANSGFLTELKEGIYYSNGVNSSCTYIVKANCEIEIVQ